jgi:formylglycine-generating enzyme required for sulfatase activity
MKQLIVTIFLCCDITLFAQAPEINNFRCEQQDYPSKTVEIQYDLEAISETVDVQLLISDDAGETWTIPFEHFHGDIGERINPGLNKLAYWDVGRDYPNQVNNNMMIRIVADDGLEPGNGGEVGEERVFELIDGVEIVMCWIPVGSFMMGGQEDELDAQEFEYPRHRVNVNNGFWIGKYEVTQGLWNRILDRRLVWDHGSGEEFPVYNLSWNDCQLFISEINENQGHQLFRLPSESEWEYACRAGTDDMRFFWGNDNGYEHLGTHSWYVENSGREAHEVGQKRSNPWGLNDMIGNVQEWCMDSWHPNYVNAPNDGTSWVEGGILGSRILRGGSFNHHERYCRPATRSSYNINWRHYTKGFRLVRDAG